MEFWIVLAAIVAFVILAVLATSVVCFFKIFYFFRSKKEFKEQHPIPEGEIYEVHRDNMVRWIDDAHSLPHRELQITSRDGLKLYGNYYEFNKGATIEILFHGYKGSALRDLSGGIYRCRRLGHNVLVVDHRASGKSEGRVITFGVKECLDCLDWIDLVIKEIDSYSRARSRQRLHGRILSAESISA